MLWNQSLIWKNTQGGFLPLSTAYILLSNREYQHFSFGDSFLLMLNVNYTYNLTLTRRGINNILWEFDFKDHIVYFILEHSIFASCGDSFPLNLIVNYRYNLVLTRRRINMMESEFDFKEDIS
jgi:hypothetical protein